jgi:hypothetical protein
MPTHITIPTTEAGKYQFFSPASRNNAVTTAAGISGNSTSSPCFSGDQDQQHDAYNTADAADPGGPGKNLLINQQATGGGRGRRAKGSSQYRDEKKEERWEEQHDQSEKIEATAQQLGVVPIKYTESTLSGRIDEIYPPAKPQDALINHADNLRPAGNQQPCYQEDLSKTIQCAGNYYKSLEPEHLNGIVRTRGIALDFSFANTSSTILNTNRDPQKRVAGMLTDDINDRGTMHGMLCATIPTALRNFKNMRGVEIKRRMNLVAKMCTCKQKPFDTKDRNHRFSGANFDGVTRMNLKRFQRRQDPPSAKKEAAATGYFVKSHAKRRRGKPLERHHWDAILAATYCVFGTSEWDVKASYSEDDLASIALPTKLRRLLPSEYNSKISKKDPRLKPCACKITDTDFVKFWSISHCQK